MNFMFQIGMASALDEDDIQEYVGETGEPTFGGGVILWHYQ
jgi:hypothetical protein